MMLPFLVDNRAELPQLEAPARALGMAMQITNILRDVGEDARLLQRVYLPDTLLQRYGLENIPLESLDRPPEGYAALTEELMQRAEAAFDEGMAAIPSLKRSVRPGIDAAARIYREILNEIRARGYDNLSSRAYTSRLRKLQVLCVDGYVRRKNRLLAKQPSLLLSPPA